MDESAIATVRKGMKVQVGINAAPSANVAGTVAEIDPAADPNSHSFTVKIDLPPSSQFRAGMYGTAEFANGMRQAIVIPRSAVVSRGSLVCAYVLDAQGIAQLRYLTIGAAQGNLVEVLSGVSPGEQLVDTPADRESGRQAHRGPAMKQELGIAGKLAHTFLNSKLTPLFIAASLAIGAFAIAVIPREEEPQILVPMLDITTAMPGASPAEVEQRVTLPIENLVHEISGVEYVYSTSSPGQSLVIVRFLVGTPQEDALIKVYSKLYSNFDRMPPGVSQPLIKARSIDDVPILALTLWGEHYNGYQLRAIAAEMQHNFERISDVSETTIIGGLPRTMRVVLNTDKLNAYGMSPLAIVQHLQAANSSVQAGSFGENNHEVRVDAGNVFARREDLEGVVVGVVHGHAIYLRDVAGQIVEGPSDPSNYVVFGTTHAASSSAGQYPAVTITVAKRKGTNATDIANAVLESVHRMQGVAIPNDVTVTTTRNYGETAKAKSDELLEHLLLATLSVTLLIAIFLGWRESGVVLLAIPVTLALTLSVFYFLGYTVNRVTLFALIFSIGILVDDAIVVVENMVRHFRLPNNRPSADRSRRRGHCRSWKSHHPRHLRRHRSDPAHGVCARPDGSIHAAHPGGSVGRDAVLADRGVCRFALGGDAVAAALRSWRRTRQHETEGWTTRLYRRVMSSTDPFDVVSVDVSSAGHDLVACGGGRIGSTGYGPSQNAALRQQERVAGHREYARRNAAGTDRESRASVGQRTWHISRKS